MILHDVTIKHCSHFSQICMGMVIHVRNDDWLMIGYELARFIVAAPGLMNRVVAMLLRTNP